MNEDPTRSREASASPVALLIDGEKSPARLAGAMLSQAATWGDVLIRRVYGDWSSPQMRSWSAPLSHYGMRAMTCHHPKKNAADIALTVDAVALYHQGFQQFCLCSGDSDYVPLVLWLREHGCIVVVIGQRHAPLALQRSCSTGVSADALIPAGDDPTIQEASAFHPEQETPSKQQTQARRRGEKRRGRLPSLRQVSNNGGSL